MNKALETVIRPMEKGDKEKVLAFMRQFYSGPGVWHSISEEVMQATWVAAVDPNQQGFDGYLFEEEGRAVGYAYATVYFESEIGGDCVVLDDLYLLPNCRGKGLGGRYLDTVFERYPKAKRFRIEVTPDNTGARRLYESKGYRPVLYEQLYRDI